VNKGEGQRVFLEVLPILSPLSRYPQSFGEALVATCGSIPERWWMWVRKPLLGFLQTVTYQQQTHFFENSRTGYISLGWYISVTSATTL
jgi:hypothetical protein